MIDKERYTEYHDGVAVIRDKGKLSEALKKLAAYEDREAKYQVGDQFLQRLTISEVDPDEILRYFMQETQTWVTEQQIEEMQYLGNRTMNGKTKN